MTIFTFKFYTSTHAPNFIIWSRFGDMGRVVALSFNKRDQKWTPGESPRYSYFVYSLSPELIPLFVYTSMRKLDLVGTDCQTAGTDLLRSSVVSQLWVTMYRTRFEH